MKTSMRNIKLNLTKITTLLSVAVLTLAGTNFAYAAPTNASLTVGDSRPSETTTYTFDVSTLASTSLQCIELDLGSADDGTGAITGLDTSSSTFDSGSLITSGWTVDNTAEADDKLRITNSTGEVPQSAGNVVWGAVDNGSTVDTAYYGVFTTYSDDTCSTEVESTTVQFIYTTGQQVSLTVDANFTFTVAGVASGTTTNNGDTTNVATTSTTIPFGQVTDTTNGIAAQDLAISTNANNGYNIYTKYTGQLTNGSSDTIDDHTGTNAAPTVMADDATTEEFGYSTDNLARFGASEYAGFTTTNEEVASSATSTSGTETSRVSLQAGIATTTEAGTYNSTVIYTAVPTY